MGDRAKKRDGRIQTILERLLGEMHRLSDTSFFGSLTIRINFTDGGIAGASMNIEERDICKTAYKCANQLDNKS